MIFLDWPHDPRFDIPTVTSARGGIYLNVKLFIRRYRRMQRRLATLEAFHDGYLDLGENGA